MPALDGVRVLDMTQYEAGTSCTQQLAWMGADVVKVEPPTGDPGRGVGRGSEVPQYFLNYNSNKRSIVIDLQQERGRDVLLRLIPHYDVFVENYGPGVIERMDIGYDVLSAANPRLIYGRIKGFGLSGPYAEYKSYDWVAQASAGTFSVTGEADGPPMRPGPSFADTGTGIQMALAITAAIVQQQRTGDGQLIELSMQEATTLFMRTIGLQVWGTGDAGRTGINQGGAPTGTYPCKGDDPNDYVFIMVTTTRMWDVFCSAIDRPDLITDERFADPMSRFQNAAELRALVIEWTQQRTKREAMHHLAEAGVPCSMIFSTGDLWSDPHLRERKLIQRLKHPAVGEIELMRNPVLMSGSQVPLVPAPLLGEHTAEVLSADLALDGAALKELQAAGAITQRQD